MMFSGEPAAYRATRHEVTRRSLTRWFQLLRFIVVSSVTDPYRVYDQVLICGTYFGPSSYITGPRFVGNPTGFCKNSLHVISLIRSPARLLLG